MSNELTIKNQTKFTVNGRELQKKCGSTGDHIHWSDDQITKGSLINGESYSWSSTNRSDGKAGKPLKTIWFTPEVAAIIQALSKTQIGVQTTVALIQHAAQKQHQLSLPQTYGEALLAYAQEVVKSEALQKTVDQLLESEPTGSRVDAQIKANGEFTLRELAKSLGRGPNKLNEFLSGKGPMHMACKAAFKRHNPVVVIYMHKGKWVPHVDAVNKGWARMHTPLVGGSTGAYTVITPKGMVRIRDYLTHIETKLNKVPDVLLGWIVEDDKET